MIRVRFYYPEQCIALVMRRIANLQEGGFAPWCIVFRVFVV